MSNRYKTTFLDESAWQKVNFPPQEHFSGSRVLGLSCLHIWVFFHKHSRFPGKQGKERVFLLSPVYDFHPLHRHLDISRMITVEGSPLHILADRLKLEPLISESKSLTTKLRALIRVNCQN